MQTTSAVWKALWAGGNARLESEAVIAGREYAAITAPVIERALTQDGLSIGNAVSATCRFSVRAETAIPKAAEVKIRMRLTDGETTSEWLPAGTFYIAHRTRDAVTGVTELTCYDALLKANAAMEDVVPWTTETGEVMTTGTGEVLYFSAVYPRDMAGLAADLAIMLGVELDPRTRIGTGTLYGMDAPEPGETIRDVLGHIAAANGGNWIITPENRLRLVPLTDADQAEATVEAVAVTGGVAVSETGTITGVRYPVGDEGETVLIGSSEGLVIDAEVSGGLADALAARLIGLEYRPYELTAAMYDPAAELGDGLTRGEDVKGVLMGETATLGPAFRADARAPEPEELADEYPYIGASARALTAAKVYAAKQVEALSESLDQAEVFDRLTNGGQDQGVYLREGKIYINGTYIRAGEILADRIRGGTLTLGGADNVNGQMVVLDANGNAVAWLSNYGLRMFMGAVALTGANGYVSIDNSDAPLRVNHKNADGSSYDVRVESGALKISNTADGSGAVLDGNIELTSAKDDDHYPHIDLWNSSQKTDVYLSADHIAIKAGSSDTRVFYVGSDGHIYAAGKLTAAEAELSSPLPVGSGGTGIRANPFMRVNLGTENGADVFTQQPRPGVSGTLPVRNGGTGASTPEGARASIGSGCFSGTFTTGDGKTVTVSNGFITNVS